MTTQTEPKASVLWISWDDHRRTRSIAEAMEIPLRVLNTRWKSPLLRCPVLAALTSGLLLVHRPKLLMVQNPSVVLAVLAVLLRPLFGYRMVMDAHNEAVEPYVHDAEWMRRLARWLLGKADQVIVTNRWLAELVRQAGGRPLVLPDRIPEPGGSGNPVPLQKSVRHLVLVATYARDEPIETVLAAAGEFPERLVLHVTGNYRRLDRAIREQVAPNVRFTGFLTDADYWGLLQAADGVVDLTAMDHCMVCGAYEALAVGKPALLSDNRATREYFGSGAVYTDNTVVGTMAAIRALLDGMDTLAQAQRELRRLRDRQWWEQAAELAAIAGEPVASGVVTATGASRKTD